MGPSAEAWWARGEACASCRGWGRAGGEPGLKGRLLRSPNGTCQRPVFMPALERPKLPRGRGVDPLCTQARARLPKVKGGDDVCDWNGSLSNVCARRVGAEHTEFTGSHRQPHPGSGQPTHSAVKLAVGTWFHRTATSLEGCLPLPHPQE